MTRSPTMEGLRLTFSRPSIGLAETAWRWTFGAASWATLVFLVLEYFDSLRVSRGTQLLLRSGVPWLVADAIRRILVSGAERFSIALLIVIAGIAVLWIFTASIGRAATLNAILEHFQNEDSPLKNRPNPTALPGIHLLRAALFICSNLAWLGCALLASFLFSSSDAAPGSAFLFCLGLWFLVGIVWTSVDRLLSISAIFAMRDGEDTFGAFSASLEFVLTHRAEVARVTALFALIHVATFVVATSIATIPLPLIRFLPPGITVLGVSVLTLVYCGVIDFLKVAKLAAYVCVLERPIANAGRTALYQPPLPSPLVAGPRDEDDILSDIPGLVPPPEPA